MRAIKKLEENKKKNLESQATPSVLKTDSKVPFDKRQSIKYWKSILAEKGIKGHKFKENEKPNNRGIKSPLKCEKSNNVQNSKSEKEMPTKVDKIKNIRHENLKKNQILLDKNHRKSFAVLMSEVVELDGEFFCPEDCGKSFRKKTHLPKVIY